MTGYCARAARAGRLRFIAILLTVGLVALAAPWLASADEGDVKVVAATAESSFPDGIVFRVAAESPGIIDEVRVFFKKAEQGARSAYRSFDFEPGESVEGETMVSTSGAGGYFPPGTKITYHFEVRDKAGGVVRTEETEFVYIDNRFQWLTVSDDLITVYYYSEYVEERARIILDAARQTMDNMVPVLGIAPTEPLRIVTYNNYRHMSMALPFRSAAVNQDLVAQGMAFADERVLLIHGFDPTVTGTVSHEFVHLLVAEAAGGTAAAIPSWLNEGLAEYGNIDQTDDYDAALRYGIYTRRIRPLSYLQSFTGEPEDILIAYGQGKSVVNFMVRKWGEDRISRTLRRGSPDPGHRRRTDAGLRCRPVRDGHGVAAVAGAEAAALSGGTGKPDAGLGGIRRNGIGSNRRGTCQLKKQPLNRWRLPRPNPPRRKRLLQEPQPAPQAESEPAAVYGGADRGTGRRRRQPRVIRLLRSTGRNGVRRLGNAGVAGRAAGAGCATLPAPQTEGRRRAYRALGLKASFTASPSRLNVKSRMVSTPTGYISR